MSTLDSCTPLSPMPNRVDPASTKAKTMNDETAAEAVNSMKHALGKWDTYQPDISKDQIVTQAWAMAEAIRSFLELDITGTLTKERDEARRWATRYNQTIGVVSAAISELRKEPDK